MAVIFLVFGLLAAFGCPLHASKDYPSIVRLERTDSELFVSRPNVVKDVDTVSVSKILPTPKGKEFHLYTDREITDEHLACLDDPKTDQSQLKSFSRDLPGMFVCYLKTLYIIPVIKVEPNRFFNVSLDFLKLESQSSFVKVQLKTDVPRGVSFDVSSTGIVFVSGMLKAVSGTQTFGLSFKSDANRKSSYKIKIIIELDPSKEEGAKDRQIDFRMMPTSLLPTDLSDIQKQIQAVKCSAKIASISPSSLYRVNREREFVKNFTLGAYAENGVVEKFCGLDLQSTKSLCTDFIITEIILEDGVCDGIAGGAPHKIPDITESVESYESDENYFRGLDPFRSEVNIKNGEIVTSPSVSTQQTTPTAAKTSSNTASLTTETTSVTRTTEASSGEAGENHESDGNAVLNSIDSGIRKGRNPGVDRSEEPDTTVGGNGFHENHVSNPVIDDRNLKTAMYGILGLSAIAVAVIFTFLFSKLELCKKKAGYDPVFVARHADETAKFA